MAEEKLTEERENEADNLAGTSETRDERVKEDVLGQVQRILHNRTEKENVWVVCDRLWRGDPISRYFPTAYQTHIPEPYKTVQAAVPRLEMALFPDDDWFRVKQIGSAGVDEKGSKLLLMDQLKDGQFFSRFRQALQITCKYGDAFAKACWVQDRRKLTAKESKLEVEYKDGEAVGVKDKGAREKEVVINRDRTEFVPLSPLDFVFDWRFDSIYDAPGCGDISRQNREYIQSMIDQEYWSNVTTEDLDKLIGQGVRQQTALPGQDLKTQATGADQMPIKAEDDIMVLDWWGLIEIDEDTRVEGQVMMLLSPQAKNGQIVRIAVNNQWHGRRPYVHNRWEPIEGEGLSIGLIEPITRLCQDLNDMQNVINVASALTANPMYKVGDDMDVYDEEIVAKPGRTFRGRDISQMQPLVQPDMTGVARMTKEDTRREIEETTQIPRLYYGGLGEKTDTATEFQGRTRQANLGLRDRVLYTARLFLEPFLEMCLYNNQQFLEEERAVLVTGDAGTYSMYTVMPDKLRGIARAEMKLMPQIELAGQRGQMMTQFMTMAASMGPLAFQPPFKDLLKLIWENTFGRQDIDILFPPSAAEMKYTQREENYLMAKDVPIEVKKWHPHMDHLMDMAAHMDTEAYDRLDASIKAIFNAHFETHNMYARQAEQAAQAAGGMGPMGGAGTPPGQPTPQLEGQLAGNVLGREAQEQFQGV